MIEPPDVLDQAKKLRASGEPFAIATVVRTVAPTPAKAGAKALIRADGTISAGWIGGGCARSAVFKAALQAIRDGRPRLVSVLPTDALRELGVQAGQSKQGVEFACNMCASQGTMDVFVEPVLPKPELLICGANPVAIALADLGKWLGFFVTVAASAEDHEKFTMATASSGITTCRNCLERSATSLSRRKAGATRLRSPQASLLPRAMSLLLARIAKPRRYAMRWQPKEPIGNASPPCARRPASTSGPSRPKRSRFLFLPRSSSCAGAVNERSPAAQRHDGIPDARICNRSTSHSHDW
jgi:hypothetical protein